MKSIRERRGEKVKILVPIFKDTNTNCDISIVKDGTAEHDDTDKLHEKYPGHIYMDSMHFGMGCSCPLSDC